MPMLLIKLTELTISQMSKATWKDRFLFFRNKGMDWAYKWLVQFLFQKILGGAVGGIKGWLLKLAIKYGWKKLIKPAAYKLARKINTAIKRPIYKKKAKAVVDAKTDDEAITAIDDMP